jgi:carbamoyl-phosphate synthase large subunit
VPRRNDIHTILVIGSGPIVIGQACEFDYSGTQACQVLRAEGYRVVLVNSNPATIMTDPKTADVTYVEPLDIDVLIDILEKEKPDAILPTLGGQTALNLTMELVRRVVPQRLGIEVIGAKPDAIETAENREMFKAAMADIGLAVPESGFAHSVEEAVVIATRIGWPIIIRPSFILGGAGTGIAHEEATFRRLAAEGIAASPVGEILVEKSIAGWKEYELEVMRDHKDNCVIVCSIENFDPMGVHTGDSITVAPIQTLSDVEYQAMRDDAFAVLRRVGVETGGSNVQFAVNPENGERLVIEMNPRVSRSSALASKATGFPIARIAARLAVGYTLDEIQNDITKLTPASFEPSIDYVVTKIPRWAFEKLPGAKPELGTRMQSVGEVMAIGRTFPESLQKAIRSLEQGRPGFALGPHNELSDVPNDELWLRCETATPDRLYALHEVLWRGATVEQVFERTKIDPWFVEQLAGIVERERELCAGLDLTSLDRRGWRRFKQWGFSDTQIASFTFNTVEDVRRLRITAGVATTFKTVDTCAAEFDALTPYHYSTYEDDSEVRPSSKHRVIILGSGPNRIGQGIEFDYCCVHAAMALRERGYETIMVNCNPETVSTDYSTSDRLYFEPLTEEDLAEVIAAEAGACSDGATIKGVIVSLGGQTPLKLAHSVSDLVLGTPVTAIDAAEDRQRWSEICDRLQLRQPPGGVTTTLEGARAIVAQVGYPVLVRPSYVLGGRAMEIVYDDNHLTRVMNNLTSEHGALAREGGVSAERPILIDHFLEDATEVDVDAIRDHTGDVFIAGIMEHVEEAGVHSGDSACALPPQTLSTRVEKHLHDAAVAIANELGVVGLLNVQFAVKDEDVFVIEANPRASRTVPFVAKATGVPVAQVATLVMVGETLAQLRAEGLVPATTPRPAHVSVKEAVLPFNRFPGVDTVLGPEMRSTGEVMGVGESFGIAFAKAQLAAGTRLPSQGRIFFSVNNKDKAQGLELAHQFAELGFSLVATSGTAQFLRDGGLVVEMEAGKIGEVDKPNAVELIEAGEIQLVVNTPSGSGSGGRADGSAIRTTCVQNGVPCLTTLSAAVAAIKGIADTREHGWRVHSLQELNQ